MAFDFTNTKVSDTHKRATFLVRKELLKKIDTLAKDQHGFKTSFINFAIEKALIDTFQSHSVIQEIEVTEQTTEEVEEELDSNSSQDYQFDLIQSLKNKQLLSDKKKITLYIDSDVAGVLESISHELESELGSDIVNNLLKKHLFEK